MKLTIVILLTIGVGLILAPGKNASAQIGAGQGLPRYNKATEITVAGTVQQIKELTSSGIWPGIHVLLKTEDETLDVHLGPSQFVKSSELKIEVGDELEVTGSKAKVDEKDAFLARQLIKGDKTLTLRDEQGFPLWSGRRRR